MFKHANQSLRIKTTTKSTLQWLVLLLVATALFETEYFANLDDRFNDHWRREIASVSLPDDSILIIEIDDKSLTELESEIGRWPWPRSVHAFLVDGLINAGAKAVVFDILFSERDLYQPDADKYFAETVSAKKNIFFAVTQLAKDSPVDAVSIDILPENFINKRGNVSKSNTQININLPWIINVADWNIGLIDFFADKDGIARKYPILTVYDDWELFSLPQKVVSFVLPNKEQVNANIVNLKYKSGDLFNYLSYFDARYLLDNQDKLELFKDKIVLIGPNATGLHDFHNTPLTSKYPGTAVLATAIDNLLNDDFLEITNRNYGLLLLLMLISLLWLITLYFDGYKKQLIYSNLFILIAALGLYFMSFTLAESDTLFPSVSIMVLVISAMVIIIFYRGLKEYLSRQHTLQTFSSFMDPVIVKQLINDEDWQQKIANKSSQVSVLFSDIRGFTTLSEKRSAEEIMQILNAYFDSQVEAIFSTRGTLDKFIGDAIMAFWGAPVEDENHAINAVQAALMMVDNLMVFRETLPQELRSFDVGIGVHSGEAVVGMLGSSKRFDYTAIGDTVNLASRIEGATKGVARVLVSETTMKLCGDAFKFEYSGEFSVKGREEKVKLYKPSLI
jgi:adenylate cyclase